MRLTKSRPRRRILEGNRRCFSCCSADFGPRLPANQLYNKQKIDYFPPTSGVSSCRQNNHKYLGLNRFLPGGEDEEIWYRIVHWKFSKFTFRSFSMLIRLSANDDGGSGRTARILRRYVDSGAAAAEDKALLPSQMEGKRPPTSS